MKKEKIGVGIIGASAGSWAITAHIPALKKLDRQFEIVAVSTSNMPSAKATTENFGIPNAFDNEYDLVNHPDVDLVVVAVKVSTHEHLVKTALEAGKMVYCEWPLGNGTTEAKVLTDLAAKKKHQDICRAAGPCPSRAEVFKRPDSSGQNRNGIIIGDIGYRQQLGHQPAKRVAGLPA